MGLLKGSRSLKSPPVSVGKSLSTHTNAERVSCTSAGQPTSSGDGGYKGFEVKRLWTQLLAPLLTRKTIGQVPPLLLLKIYVCI